MLFNVKRYFYGLAKYRTHLLLALIIPVIFLAVTGTIPDRYSIYQTFSVSDSSPIAKMTDPVGCITLKELLSDPSSFFMNAYALNKLSNSVLSGWTEKYGTVLEEMIKTSMSLTHEGENRVQIRYHGKNRELGEILVNYYADRLLKKSQEGIVRSGQKGTGFTPELSGSVKITEERALWRHERLKPFLVCCLVSLIITLILVGVLEWSDSSFKSERQIARYTGLPILGNIPDLNKIAALMKTEGGGSV